MPSKDLQNVDDENVKSKLAASTHVMTAESAEAEEVPTIPIESLETLSELQPEVAIHPTASTRAVRMPQPLVVQPSEYHRGFTDWVQVWWDGVRPAYLSLSLLPVLIGSVLAWTQTISSKTPLGKFHLTHFIAAIVAIVLLQIGANLVNDYYDYLRGIDTTNTFGPGGLIQQGLIQPLNVLLFGLAALSAGTLIGLVIAFRGGVLVYLLGLIGLLAAYFYSATLRSISSLTLGELVVLCVYGPLITLGAYMIQMGHADRNALIYGLPLGLLATAAIHVNNMRDSESDAYARKHTLASRLGLNMSRALFLVLVFAAYAIVVWLALPHGAQHLLLITLWTLPTLGLIITGVLRTDSPSALNLVMRQTLRLEVYFALLLAIALLVSAWLPMFPQIPTHFPFG